MRFRRPLSDTWMLGLIVRKWVDGGLMGLVIAALWRFKWTYILSQLSTGV